MKKLLSLIFLLSSTCFAQYTPTPNIGLQIPATGSNNWNIPLNLNFNLLDQYLSGVKPIPALSVTDNVIVGGTVQANGFIGPGGAAFAFSTASNQWSVPYYSSTTPSYTLSGVSLTGIPFYSGSSAPTSVTAANLATVLKLAANCNVSSSYFYSPYTNSCSTAGTAFSLAELNAATGATYDNTGDVTSNGVAGYSNYLAGGNDYVHAVGYKSCNGIYCSAFLQYGVGGGCPVIDSFTICGGTTIGPTTNPVTSFSQIPIFIDSSLNLYLLKIGAAANSGAGATAGQVPCFTGGPGGGSLAVCSSGTFTQSALQAIMDTGAYSINDANCDVSGNGGNALLYYPSESSLAGTANCQGGWLLDGTYNNTTANYAPNLIAYDPAGQVQVEFGPNLMNIEGDVGPGLSLGENVPCVYGCGGLRHVGEYAYLGFDPADSYSGVLYLYDYGSPLPAVDLESDGNQSLFSYGATFATSSGGNFTINADGSFNASNDAFNVNPDGSFYAQNDTFEVDSGGSVYAAGGYFYINTDGSFSASAGLFQVDPSGGVLANGTAVFGGVQSNQTMSGEAFLTGNVPNGNLPGMVLYNAGGGSGSSVSLDFYNTNNHSNIPQARVIGTDDGNFGDNLTLSTKQDGASANPLVPRLQVGVVSAPSGGCSNAGEWIFSEDAHLSVCLSGVWVLKI
jgi:hypothetical protein